MEKVYNIEDKITNKYFKNFKCTWSGKIVIDDTGWFEGYLKRPESTNGWTEDYLFTFGIYHPNKVLDLYICSSTNIYPNVFKGELIGSKYVGKLSEFYSNTDDMYTNSLSIKESKSNIAKVKDKTDALKKQIKEKELHRFEENRLRTNFYNKVYENRIALNDILVKASEGITFTEEDRLSARHLNNEKREARKAIKIYMLNR